MKRRTKGRKTRGYKSWSPMRRLAFEQLDGRLVLSAGALGEAAVMDVEPVSDAGFVARAEAPEEAAGGQSDVSPEISPSDPSDLLVFFIISTQSNAGSTMAPGMDALPEDGPMPQAANGPSLVANEPGSDSGLSGFLTLEANGTADSGIVIALPDPDVFGPHVRGWNYDGVFGPHVRGWNFDAVFGPHVRGWNFDSAGQPLESSEFQMGMSLGREGSSGEATADTGTVETEIVAMQLSSMGTFDTELVAMQLSDIAPPTGVVITASEGSNATGHFETELVALDPRAADSFFDVFFEIELPGAVGGNGPAGFTEADLEAFILDLELDLD